MKDSEAACATLGMNLTLTKLAVFSLSAAIAGVGGALYGGMLQSINPENFSFINGLPIFMLTARGLELDPQVLMLDLGISKMILKPFSPRELLRDVQKELGLESVAAGSAG